MSIKSLISNYCFMPICQQEGGSISALTRTGAFGPSSLFGTILTQESFDSAALLEYSNSIGKEGENQGNSNCRWTVQAVGPPSLGMEHLQGLPGQVPVSRGTSANAVQVRLAFSSNAGPGSPRA